MNFNEIKNRLFIGALAITVFPFYVHAQNDKMEGQTAHRTKAWEIGVGGALINWDRVTFSDFRQVDGNYLYRMNIDHLFGGIQLYAARELNPWFYLDLQGTLGLARKQVETGGRKFDFMYMAGPGLQFRLTPLFKSKYVEPYLRVGVNYLHHDFYAINAGKFENDPIGEAEWTSSNPWNKEKIGSKQSYFPLSFGAGVQAWLNDHWGVGLQGEYIMPVDKKQTRFVQASMRIMFRLGGSTKRPMPVVQYIDRPVDRIVERIVEKRIEVPAVVESHVCDLFDNIHFAFDKDVITSESEITLDKIADLLKSYPDNNFLITGYTDARGSDNYNIDLSKRRAKAVQYIDRPVDRIVERIVEKRIEVPAVVESHVCDLFDNIHFAFDKDVITSESEITLDKIADLLKSYPDNNFLITGYTDARGSDNYNIDLSKRRAKAVYSALLKRQVPQHMLKWRGVGYHASSVPASGPDKVRMGDRKVSIERVTNSDYWGWLTNEE